MKVRLKGYVTDNDSAAVYRRWGYTDLCCPGDIEKAIANCQPGEVLEFDVNSGGGSVYMGVEMYTLIRGYKGRTVGNILALAGSAMSVAMAGCDEVRISPAGNVMIHRASTYQHGNSEAMGQTKQMLDTIDESILTAYTGKAKEKTSKEALAEMMRNETFFTAERAVEVGLADSIMTFDDKEADPRLAVASMDGTKGLPFVELPPVEDLLRMEQERNAGKEEEAGEQDPTAEAAEVEALNSDQGDLGVQNNQTGSEEEMAIENVEQLIKQFPDLTAQIQNQAAEQERARIAGIDALAMAGFEEIIAKAKADPTQDAGTVAQAIIKAQKEAGETFLADRKKDATPANEVKPADKPKEETAKLTPEEEAEAEAKAAVAAYYGEGEKK